MNNNKRIKEKNTMSTPKKPIATTTKPKLYTTEKVLSAYQSGKQHHTHGKGSRARRATAGEEFYSVDPWISKCWHLMD